MGEMLMCYRRDNDTMVDPLGTTDGDLKAMRPLALADRLVAFKSVQSRDREQSVTVTNVGNSGKTSLHQVSMLTQDVKASSHVVAHCLQISAAWKNLGNSVISFGQIRNCPTIGHPHSLLCLCGQFSHVWTSIKATGECSSTKKKRYRRCHVKL